MTSKESREKVKPAHEALMKFYPLTLEDLPGELWKLIPDCNKYQISNYGRVKSFKGKVPRILKPALSCYGYLYVNLSKGKKIKSFFVHRLVAQAFIPNPEGKPQINHIDGHPLNNHVSNLEWATNSENQKHAYDTGLKAQGEDRSDSKLTNEQVRYIRDNPLGLNCSRLAEMFSVACGTISRIQLGKRYKIVGGSVRQTYLQQPNRIPDDVREQICAEYVRSSREFGSRALAKKYDINPQTIMNIVYEKERRRLS